MKKVFKFLLAILFLAVSLPTAAKGKLTTINGTIKGHNGEETLLVKDMFDENGKDIPIKVDKNGAFKLSFEMEKKSFDGCVYVGNLMYAMYLQPGGNYTINIDATKEGDDSNYIISGSNAKENLLVKNYVFKLQRAYLFWDKLKDLESFKDYNAIITDKAESLKAELQATGNTEFIAVMKKRIEQDQTYLRFLFGFNALQNEAFKNGNLSNMKSNEDYDRFLKSPEWTSIDEKVFLKFKETFMFNVMFSFPNLSTIEILKNVKKELPTQNAVNLYATAILTNFLSKGENGDIEQVFEYYKTICTDPEALKAMEASKNLAKKVAKGAPAPEFEMKDISGKVFNVADFKGKALYIDVWATWCGPCKVEIPFFKKLVEKYKDDNRIEFISVSIDSNKKAWEKMIGVQVHQWKQLIVDNDMNSELCKKYQIESIPRFILFDKEGKIVTVTAPHPSDESLIEVINKIL